MRENVGCILFLVQNKGEGQRVVEERFLGSYKVFEMFGYLENIICRYLIDLLEDMGKKQKQKMKLIEKMEVMINFRKNKNLFKR